MRPRPRTIVRVPISYGYPLSYGYPAAYSQPQIPVPGSTMRLSKEDIEALRPPSYRQKRRKPTRKRPMRGIQFHWPSALITLLVAVILLKR